MSVGAGYSLSMGSIDLVPGFSWTLHLLNDFKDLQGFSDVASRNMNIMLTVRGEFNLSDPPF